MRKQQSSTSADFEKLRQDLVDAGHNLWLAGLGAAAQVEEEGRDLFDQLVERGRKMETRQFKAIDRTVADTSERLRKMSGRFQNGIEDRLQEVMKRLGVPTRNDFRDLSSRIDALSKKVDQVSAKP